MDLSFAQVSLSPTPGFCIKSATLEPGILPSPSPNGSCTSDDRRLLELDSQPVSVPKGMKVFVNVCYDKNVPPPPEGTEESIQRAIKGEDGSSASAEEEEQWYVPVVVSEPRTDKDKAGKESLVVDCVYNAQVRKRAASDPEFKVFLVELGLQRIEAQTGLTLSRSIGTPNIAAKGKLAPRIVKMPTALLAKTKEEPKSAVQMAHTPASSTRKGKEKVDGTTRPLIEEIIQPPPPKPKGILKSSTTPADLAIPLDVSWSWEKTDSGRLTVTIHIPDLTADSITSGNTYLDVEPRRIILTLPTDRVVDIDRTLSDAELVAKIHDRARVKADQVKKKAKAAVKEGLREEVMAESDKEVTRMLVLKREREFDVDGAEAEWIVKDRKLIITL